MSSTHDRIDEDLRAFIDAQVVFFVATAPSGGDGHVNLSPKGYVDTFVVLDEHRVAYLDLTGSGAETIAHLCENGRITLMFCAFEGEPNVLRLQGRGRCILPPDGEFDDLRARFGPRSGVRSVIVVDVARISTSCGYAVPFLDYQGERDKLDEHWASQSEAAIQDYKATHNARSIDGLSALPALGGRRGHPTG